MDGKNHNYISVANKFDQICGVLSWSSLHQLLASSLEERIVIAIGMRQPYFELYFDILHCTKFNFKKTKVYHDR